MLKITHIASGDLWAGAEAQLLTLCKSLNSMNELRIDVILLNNGELEHRLKSENIDVCVFQEGKYSSYQIYKKIKSRLILNQPDLVHTHRTKENILGSLAARSVGISSIRTVHGDLEKTLDWRKPQRKLIQYLNWLTGRYIQKRLVAVSLELRNILIKSYPDFKVLSIENGVDIEGILDNSYFPSSLSNTESIKVGFVGRLVPVKRVDIFLKIAKQCASSLPNNKFEFIVFGDGPLMEELKDISLSLDLGNIVTFKGHTNNIHADIAQLDILLITSDHEGLPMTLLESMTLETIVISHDVGGIRKALDDGKAGILIKSNSAENYVGAIKKCINKPDFVKETIKIAKKQIIDNYSASINAKNYLIEYRKLL